MTTHTIVLTQSTPKSSSKSYNDFETVSAAMDGVVAAFEQTLPPHSAMTYDISQLFQYIDGLIDLAVLTFDDTVMAYRPHDKVWIKQTVLAHLKQTSSTS